MTEEMKIHITEDGMKVEALGFAGKTCLKELKDLEKFLQSAGIDFKVDKQVLKSEVYQTTPIKQEVRRY